MKTGDAILPSGNAQLETLHRALPLVTDWRAAIDGGANVGAWSEVLAGHFETVHAFEPSPGTFEALGRALGGNARVIAYRAALLDRVGPGMVWSRKGNHNRRGCWAQLKPEGHEAMPTPADALDAPVTTVDTLGLDGCGLIKLDLEGGELPALRGAARTLARCRPVVIVEVHGRLGKRHGWTPDDLEGWMTTQRYRLAFAAAPDRVYVPL